MRVLGRKLKDPSPSLAGLTQRHASKWANSRGEGEGFAAGVEPDRQRRELGGAGDRVA